MVKSLLTQLLEMTSMVIQNAFYGKLFVVENITTETVHIYSDYHMQYINTMRKRAIQTISPKKNHQQQQQHCATCTEHRRINKTGNNKNNVPWNTCTQVQSQSDTNKNF